MDSNTVALDRYMTEQDNADQSWAAFEASLDHDEAVESALTTYRYTIIEELLNMPEEPYYHEAMLALMEHALYEGKRKQNAWDEFVEAVQRCKFFANLLHAEKDKLYSIWLDHERYG